MAAGLELVLASKGESVVVTLLCGILRLPLEMLLDLAICQLRQELTFQMATGVGFKSESVTVTSPHGILRLPWQMLLDLTILSTPTITGTFYI